jgi:aspartate/tyrosine/aromatic aminotransferase
MSLSWRERVARTKKRLMEALDLTQEDWDYIKENIGMFCA